MKSPNFDNVKDFRSFIELSVDIDTDDSVYITGLNDNGLHIGWIGTKEKAITVLKTMRDLFTTTGAIEKSICILSNRFNITHQTPTLNLSVVVTPDVYILNEHHKVSDINNMIDESKLHFMNRFNTLFPRDRLNMIGEEINQLIKFINDDAIEPEDLTENQLRLKSMLLGIKQLTESKLGDIIQYNSDDNCKRALSQLNGLFYAYNNK